VSVDGMVGGEAWVLAVYLHDKLSAMIVKILFYSRKG